MTIPSGAVSVFIGEQEYYSMLAFEATTEGSTLVVRFLEGRKDCCCCGHPQDRYSGWMPFDDAVKRGMIVKATE